MTADEIKALVERLKSKRKMHLANASDVECLDALETLALENTRLRLEFRADCEKQAEELFAVQADAERYRYLRETTKAIRDDNGNNRTEVTPEDFDERVDAAIAARSQSEEKT